MPKTINVYECELCHQRYDDFSNAVLCENNGLPTGEVQEKLSKINKNDL